MDQLLAAGGVITLIHFCSAIDPTGNGDEDWRIACMPSMKEFHQTPFHPAQTRSNDTRAVTCPACKKSAAFKASQDALSAVITKRESSGR